MSDRRPHTVQTFAAVLTALVLLAGCSGEPADVKTRSSGQVLKQTLTQLDVLDREIAAGTVNRATLFDLATDLDYLRGTLADEKKADEATTRRIEGFATTLRDAASHARPASPGKTTVTEEGIPLPASDQFVVDPADVSDTAAQLRTFLLELG